MILPTKRVNEDKALITVGGKILELLDRPKTISRLWEEYKQRYRDDSEITVSYDWFVLAIDLLYMIGAIDKSNGEIYKSGE